MRARGGSQYPGIIVNGASPSLALVAVLLAACGGNVVVDSASTLGASSTAGAGGSSSGVGSSSGGGGTSTVGGGAGGSTSPAVVCPGELCAFGDSGYAYAYSDSENSAPLVPGTSTATLAGDGSLCISGNVMALPPTPTEADYDSYWGCGIGINLDQPPGSGAPGDYQLTGTGVTVSVENLPPCTTARVILDQNGGSPTYCAPLTPGVEIPWASFNTACWLPAQGTALSGPPDSQSIEIQFVTSLQECSFTNFCITAVTL